MRSLRKKNKFLFNNYYCVNCFNAAVTWLLNVIDKIEMCLVNVNDLILTFRWSSCVKEVQMSTEVKGHPHCTMLPVLGGHKSLR